MGGRTGRRSACLSPGNGRPGDREPQPGVCVDRTSPRLELVTRPLSGAKSGKQIKSAPRWQKTTRRKTRQARAPPMRRRSVALATPAPVPRRWARTFAAGRPRASTDPAPHLAGVPDQAGDRATGCGRCAPQSMRTAADAPRKRGSLPRSGQILRLQGDGGCPGKPLAGGGGDAHGSGVRLNAAASSGICRCDGECSRHSPAPGFGPTTKSRAAQAFADAW